MECGLIQDKMVRSEEWGTGSGSKLPVNASGKRKSASAKGHTDRKGTYRFDLVLQ